jgi:protein-disulfide isomerase
MTLSWAAVAVALVAACANTKTATSRPDAGVKAGGPSLDSRVALDPSVTVAVVNGQEVKGSDLDKQVQDQLTATTDEFSEKIHEIRKQGLEQLVDEKIIDLEAKAKGVDKETLMKTEVKDKITPPTDEEVQGFYDRVVKGRNPVSLEDAKPQITQQLMQEKATTRIKTYLDELKAKYGVKTSLPTPPVQRKEVEAVGPAKGPANAKVTIVEFSDFECPYCSRAIVTVDEVVKKYGDKVRLVFRQFPLPFHEHAGKAAEAALCAGEQGKFWEMHDKLFANQRALEVEQLSGYAKDIGVDQAKFDECLKSGKMAATIKKDTEAGKAVGVTGTPAFFINGRMLSGAQPLDAFTEIIDSELAAK